MFGYYLPLFLVLLFEFDFLVVLAITNFYVTNTLSQFLKLGNRYFQPNKLHIYIIHIIYYNKYYMYIYIEKIVVCADSCACVLLHI